MWLEKRRLVFVCLSFLGVMNVDLLLPTIPRAVSLSQDSSPFPKVLGL